MLTKNDGLAAMRKLVQRKHAVTMPSLQCVLKTSSRVSVFRRLREIGYHSSYTHAGRYYTFAQEPEFDEHGLWFYRDIGFSRAGTLKKTVIEKVEGSENGQTHNELQNLLRVRVYNALGELYRCGNIRRETLGRVYLYVSADLTRGAEQFKERLKYQAALAEMFRVVTDEEMVEILAEALRVSPMIPMPEEVSMRLMGRGYHIEPRLVMQAYEAHGLEGGKKTPRRY